jgi:uncharacterized membrane protein YqgA involved in biofilm formation
MLPETEPARKISETPRRQMLVALGVVLVVVAIRAVTVSGFSVNALIAIGIGVAIYGGLIAVDLHRDR